jgi:hypothetical protein
MKKGDRLLLQRELFALNPLNPAVIIALYIVETETLNIH